MGYPGAQELASKSKFGQVPTNFSYSQVKCSGKEKSLDDCSHEDDVPGCGANDGAGVVCQPTPGITKKINLIRLLILHPILL